MKVKKIILIEPKTPGVSFFNYTKMPLLGLPILGTIANKMGIDTKIFCENISSINWNEIKKADLIGITVLTSLAPRAYQLAKKIKNINSFCKVIMGGPHVSFLPAEALENGADFVVRKEGERTFKKLINGLKKETNLKNIKGLSFKENNKIHHTPDREDFSNIDRLPTPDFTLVKGYEKLEYIPLQTSRGCPHNCEFCSVVQMFGNKIRYRTPDKVIKDLNNINNLFNLNDKHVFIVDDNFSANKKRTINLLKRLNELDYDFEWSTQEEVNIYKKKEVLNLMKKTGCERLYIGIESFNDNSLKEYNKPQNISDIKKAIEIIHKKDILIHGMFVLGADSDNENTIMKTAKNTVENNIDTAQFSVLVPLPGTRFYKKIIKEGRLLADKGKSWKLFAGNHVVFQPKNLTPYELQTLQLKALKKFYNIKNSFYWLTKRKYKNFITNIYGRWIIREWKNNNKSFIENLRNFK